MNSADQNIDLPDGLIALGRYQWPTSETRQTLGHIGEKLRDRFKLRASGDAVAGAELTSVSEQTAMAAAQDRLSGVLQGYLDDSYLEWARDDTVPAAARAFVHPPLNADLVEDWARAHGLAVAKPAHPWPEAACVVIPQLETWFTRHLSGLDALTSLFDTLSRAECKVIVGCNSWAWRYLGQFAALHMIFQRPETLPAFDGAALASLLQPVVSKDRMTSAKSGEAVFAREADGALCDPYFNQLANCSFGIPWVGLEMFFDGAHAKRETEEADPDLAKTWLTLPQSRALPERDRKSLCFALQAVLIHGPRLRSDLNNLLPMRQLDGLWSALEQAGWITQQQDQIRIRHLRYPDMRNELSTAGFNLDKV